VDSLSFVNLYFDDKLEKLYRERLSGSENLGLEIQNFLIICKRIYLDVCTVVVVCRLVPLFCSWFFLKLIVCLKNVKKAVYEHYYMGVIRSTHTISAFQSWFIKNCKGFLP